MKPREALAMTHKYLVLAVMLALAGAGAALAQTPPPGFAPSGVFGTQIAVTTTSAANALPVGTSVVIYNTGSQAAYVNFGTTSAVTATTSHNSIAAGGGCGFYVSPNTYIAAITATGTTTLNVAAGSGTLPGCWASINLGSVSNASLDTLFGLTGATIPQFIYRLGAGTYGGSFNGTSLDQYDSYAGVIETAQGTSGVPATTAGPIVKISRDGAPPASSCVGSNPVDSECDAALAVYAQQPAGGTVQTTALLTASTSASLGGAGAVGDALGLWASGRIIGSGVGLGTGAYLEGRRDTTTAGALGAEVRTENITGSNCGYNTTGIGICDGFWVTGAGNGTATQLSTAVHIASADGIVTWYGGITLNAACCAIYGLDDRSSSMTGIYENGTHTYAILTGATAGPVGLGLLTPDAPLEVAGAIKSDADSYCTATATFTSNVTLAGCTGMTTGTLAAGKAYAFVLRAYVTASGASGGVKVDLAGGSASATTLIAQTKIYNGTTINVSTQVAALATAVGSTAVATDIEITGTIIVNAGGTIIPRFAQNATNATSTVIGVGSSLTIRQIS
jgi:hypothetical protein